MFFAFVYNYLYFFTGCHFYENYAKIHLISFFIGSNLIFMPMHFLGILGMPRRIFDYPSCFIFWNQLETFGVFITFLSFLWFILALSPSFNNFFSKVFHSFLL